MERQTIVLERDIDAPPERVYRAFLTPADLFKWYYATEGWTTPYARIDERVGGEFHIGFRSPDGAMEFDYWGTYDVLEPSSRIVQTLGDGRKVETRFVTVDGNKTRVIWSFETEPTHSLEQQRQGWGGQLEHLATYLKSS